MQLTSLATLTLIKKKNFLDQGWRAHETLRSNAYKIKNLKKILH